MKRDYRVLLIFLWLLGLTVLLICDKIHVRINPFPPAILEPIQIEELEVDYGTSY